MHGIRRYSSSRTKACDEQAQPGTRTTRRHRGGLIIVIGEFLLNGIVLGEQFSAHRTTLGLGDPTAAELAVGAVLTLSYGIVLMWIYAAIRPRFGPGPRTALVAALTFWAIAYVLFLLSIWANGFVTFEYAMVSIAWGFFEAPIAALAGAALYRDR